MFHNILCFSSEKKLGGNSCTTWAGSGHSLQKHWRNARELVTLGNRSLGILHPPSNSTGRSPSGAHLNCHPPSGRPSSWRRHPNPHSPGGRGNEAPAECCASSRGTRLAAAAAPQRGSASAGARAHMSDSAGPQLSPPTHDQSALPWADRSVRQPEPWGDGGQVVTRPMAGFGQPTSLSVAWVRRQGVGVRVATWGHNGGPPGCLHRGRSSGVGGCGAGTEGAEHAALCAADNPRSSPSWRSKILRSPTRNGHPID